MLRNGADFSAIFQGVISASTPRAFTAGILTMTRLTRKRSMHVDVDVCARSPLGAPGPACAEAKPNSQRCRLGAAAKHNPWALLLAPDRS
jgi:hypothetical protein